MSAVVDGEGEGAECVKAAGVTVPACCCCTVVELLSD